MLSIIQLTAVLLIAGLGLNLQGGVRCCITGPAFAYLLQQPDQALVQAVALNTVAFTRMKSKQKGQLLDLLGRRGLHHMLNGQRQHIPVILFATHLAGPACVVCHDLGVTLSVCMCMPEVRLFVPCVLDMPCPACLSDSSSVCLSGCSSVCQPICLPVCLCVHSCSSRVSVGCLSVWLPRTLCLHV